jgi:hypothetical protein
VAKFSKHIETECRAMLIGSLLGEGCYRKVYRNRMDRNTVVKVEDVGGHFSNINEWNIWNKYQHTGFARWLAPCKFISPCGSVMIQARTSPVPKQSMPKKVPECLQDLKIENWGMYKGKVVCHDYGNFDFISGTKLVKADWWSREDS